METTPGPITRHVGIDVAAATLAVVLLAPGRAPPPAVTVANAAGGWRDLRAWLRAAGCRPAATRLVMEATGSYWVGAATALTAAGWAVSVVSPAGARAYAQARLVRAKTDAVDAAGLAAYSRDMRPAAWVPPPAEVRELQLLVRQRDDLVGLRTQTRNRQHALAQLPSVPAAVLEPAAAVLAVLDEQIARLGALIRQRAAAAASLAADVARLDAIQGVGLLTAAIVLAEPWGLGPGLTPAQAVAYAGLDPRPRESGASVRGASHISKTGNARLRQALFMAALSAARHNPARRPFYQRLLARGKPKLVALTAVARKLLAVMVTLLKHKRTYDPHWDGRPMHRP
jgi:transposase